MANILLFDRFRPTRGPKSLLAKMTDMRSPTVQNYFYTLLQTADFRKNKLKLFLHFSSRFLQEVAVAIQVQEKKIESDFWRILFFGFFDTAFLNTHRGRPRWAFSIN